MPERPPGRFPSSVTILGLGYTGHALAPHLDSLGIRVTATRRGRSDPRIIPFDLSDASTWTVLPDSDATVWTLPAEPPEGVLQFLNQHAGRLGKLIAVGTTSSYLQGGEDADVSEESGTDSRQPRVRGEAILMRHGGVVLRSAGIYGPSLGPHRARNPLDWLRAGRIASPERFVNLIHVEDLAASILAALGSEVSGDHFIVTDGTPRTWGSIEAWAVGKGFVRDVCYEGPGGRPSRRLSNRKLLEKLAPDLRHTDLFVELTLLEGRL